MELLTTSLLLCIHLALTTTVSAQFSNATCNAESRWMFNSKDQSPCVMASYLRAVCDGNYNVRALPEGYVYTGPSDPQYASPCWCSSVTFSMYQACSLCQSQTSLTRWGVWTANCTGPNAPTNGSFPREIPAGTAIPAWGYALYPEAATFSVEVVREFMLTNTTEFTAPLSSSSATSPRPSLSSTPSSASSGTSSSSNAGAIAGGVVGGVVGLALIAALVFFFIRRQSKKPSPPPNQAHSYAKVENSSTHMVQHAPPPPPPPQAPPTNTAPVIVAPKPRHPAAPPPSFRHQSPAPLAMSVTPTPKPNNAQQVYMPRPGSTTMQSTGHPYMPEV